MNNQRNNNSHNGQVLIDIASQLIAENNEITVAKLLPETSHRHHRMAVYAAVMCDNIQVIKQAVVSEPHVQCCALTITNGVIPDILRVDQRNSLTMTCIEYDAYECFKYLHKITNEDLNIIITKAIRYGAQKILTHLAAITDQADYIVTEARKKGLQLRICA